SPAKDAARRRFPGVQMHRYGHSVAVVLSAAAFAAVAALADEPAKAPASPGAQAPSGAQASPGAPSPEVQAMMEKYQKAATPGPEHQHMAKMAGKWKLAVTSWPAPGAPPM